MKINDKLYLDIVDDILKNKDFLKLDGITHHKANRMTHVIRVSYYSYLITKFFKLDYVSTARAGLLHDFFYEDNNKLNFKDKINSIVNHPKKSLINSKNHFKINELEEDIILSHMFPINLRVPKYLESWIVDIIDDIASIYEVFNRLLRN